MDEEFLFGSHVLVAPVTTKGATTRRVYLPMEANDGETALQWCELDTGKWHAGTGEFADFGASPFLSLFRILMCHICRRSAEPDSSARACGRRARPRRRVRAQYL